MTTEQERRQAPRVVPRFMVVATVESARDNVRTVIADLSEGGASFAPARAELSTEDELIVSLAFPDHLPVAATGRIVWIVRSEREPGRFGVRWTHRGYHRERLGALIRNCS